jgi:hypothetical protein
MDVRLSYVEIVEEERPLKLSQRIEKTFQQMQYLAQQAKW